MREIIPGLYMLEGMRIGNVYLLVSGTDLTLVDSGLAGEADRIASQVQNAGFDLSGLRTLILTHAHGDHAGSAAELVRRYRVKVMAYRDEVPYIEKTKPMPTPSIFRRIFNWMSEHMLFRQSPCKVDRCLEDGERIDVWGGIQVIHTPGHTPGSICLFQPQRRVLFCGDTLFNVNPMTNKEGLQLSLPMVTLDTAQVRKSVRELSALSVDVICFGHGEPIKAGAGERLQALLARMGDGGGKHAGWG